MHMLVRAYVHTHMCTHVHTYVDTHSTNISRYIHMYICGMSLPKYVRTHQTGGVAVLKLTDVHVKSYISSLRALNKPDDHIHPHTCHDEENGDATHVRIYVRTYIKVVGSLHYCELHTSRVYCIYVREYVRMFVFMV